MPRKSFVSPSDPPHENRLDPSPELLNQFATLGNSLLSSKLKPVNYSIGLACTRDENLILKGGDERKDLSTVISN